MNYNFPIIENINDVLPAILDSPEFIVAEKDGYTVINYVVSTNDTFPVVQSTNDAIRRECRGMIFDSEGHVLSRRYHKFFNVNEREETLLQNIDVSQPHIVLEKLDGSMITPIYVGDGYRWGTKMGITDIALPVEEFVISSSFKYEDLAAYCHGAGLTPIFEWCSNKQRIVISHENDSLILTAIRDNLTGEYLSYDKIVALAEWYNVPVVKAFRSSVDDLSSFIEELSKMEDTEGVVLRFEDGHMFKIKTEWYVRIHKAKELIQNEHEVARQILENVIDDAKAFLPNEDLIRINQYEHNLRLAIESTHAKLFNVLIDLTNKNISRKDFALEYSKDLNDLEKAIIFKCWDNRDSQFTYLRLCDTIIKNCNKAKNFLDMKNSLLFNLEF